MEQPGIAGRRSAAARLRELADEYPRAVWLMALANLVLWTGRGMVVPFTVIFFSQIVGLPASLVGTGIAIAALGGIAFVSLIAGQIDRRGGHPVLLGCLLTMALGTLAYPWATNVWLFLGATLVLNFAGQLYWPASDATFAALLPPDKVAAAFSVLRVANAVGIGLGGFIGGVLVAGGGLGAYRLLFLVSALVVLAAVGIVWRFVPAVALPSTSASGAHGTWRDVTPDRTFVYCLFVLFVLIAGFSQMQMSVPPFLRKDAGIGEGTIGALFTLNTLLVVVTQIPLATRINRSDLGLVLAGGAALWGVAFGWMLLTPALGVPAAAAAFVAFTAGELLFMPATAVIPVRLAPPHLRGRYFALSAIVWGGSWAIAAFGAGLALDLPNPSILWMVMIGIMLFGALAALRLRVNARLAPERARR